MSVISELPIAPALYQKVLESLDLQSICLDRVEAHCDRKRFDRSEVALNLSAEADATQDANYFTVYIKYTLEGQQTENVCLKIRADYRLVFGVVETVPEGFFEVFQELNLRILTLPYLRELVTSMTGRMELPTLIIPLNVFASEADDGMQPKTRVKRPRKRAAKAPAGTEGA